MAPSVSPSMSSRYIYAFATTHLNRMINGYVRSGHLNEARTLFDQNIEARNIISWNSLIAGYVKNDQIRFAQDLFDQMPKRDVVSWNTMLLGFQRTNDPEKVVQYFIQMGRVGLAPSEFTLSIVVSAVCGTGFRLLIPQLHARIVCSAFGSCVFVGSALVGGYTDLGCSISLRRVFDEIRVKNVTSWNALISGYMDLGCLAEARSTFQAMPERNVVSWTTLVNGFIRNKKLSEARLNFDRMTDRNVVTWTVMISGYEQNRQYTDALELYLLMRNSGVRPNHFTISSVLSACAGCSSLLMGQQVHSSILKSGLPVDVIVSTSLVDMYSKCGDVCAAFCIFNSMIDKNLVSWNSIIGGYARHGLGTRALEEFERMISSGVRPDYITFINVLSACGHGGLVEEGERYFMSMEAKYGIQPQIEHYACMVDMFGRAGQLEKAEKLIKEMPFEPDIIVWGALLGACGLHSSLKLGAFAAEELYKLEQDHPAIYSMLSKIHSDMGVWSSVIETKERMRDMSARKQKASSWIERILPLR
ncbi:PREDICTED: pentatricopeptide repeat-containing protein At4g02750-like [Nelumbo nucifera]|uniref:Pentatricopeptide repeat-containing protein At4g02750-like n=2 Tax=Nelumbo nucifera TaxID=4432 RepID=A0A1U8B5I8_NELNU|nr:PREDICTED: pentatricopeptide repeat-containing protein At4g02750-like [Nelumbo nucifera]DAD38336.1 TPA_asm: hypothetical protein HUJ06_008977 [Nelumbo nucifera]